MLDSGRCYSKSMRKTLLLLTLALAFPSLAQAEDYLQPVSYPETTTYSCRTSPILVYPGQNLNLLRLVSTCPNASKVSGPGPSQPSGSGYITSFAPSMVEILPGGRETTPSVTDLHLHHAVWLKNYSSPYFAVGEEKTIVSLPEGYGIPASASESWAFNYMIHSLRASEGRRVAVTWEIDWVPQAERTLKTAFVRWLDVAGAPQVYPVFDAERKFDVNGDGKFVFPDDASAEGHEENSKISGERQWTVPSDTTLVFAAGHVHPGGLWNDLFVERGGNVVKLFRSKTHFFSEPTAVSWDIAMEATPRDWIINLSAGDRVFTSATYDVSRASWFEGMGIIPLAFAAGHSPSGIDPFSEPPPADSGVLTHGRLPENIDTGAGAALGLPSPARLRTGRKYPKQISMRSFLYAPGGFSASRRFPVSLMRPPLVRTPLLFRNFDALAAMTQEQQVWHTVTSCRQPCNKDSGVSYPLADGRFDSGQMGFGINNISPAFSGGYGYLNGNVTTGSSTWRTPKLSKGNYSYFCRIHPFMRGSFRVKG